MHHFLSARARLHRYARAYRENVTDYSGFRFYRCSILQCRICETCSINYAIAVLCARASHCYVRGTQSWAEWREYVNT